MLKSGLIFGAITFVITLITGLVNFQVCAPCLVLFTGLGAGYVAGAFDKPFGTNNSAKRGAGSGAIGGAGALLGHLVGGVVGAITLGPEGAAEMMRQFGFPTGSGPSSTLGYYAGAIGGSFCFGLLDVALMAGLGALGGLLWYQIVGKNNPSGAPPAPTMPA